MPGMIDTQIEIADHGRRLRLDYAQLLAYHGGGAVAGAALGFRALQCAAAALTQDAIWDRVGLSINTAHHGPGIIDAIEFVTRCITRGGFSRMANDATDNPCGSSSSFRFRFIQGQCEVWVNLRDGVIPDGFFTAVKQRGAQPDSEQARTELEAWKVKVATRVMSLPASEVYSQRTQTCQTTVPEHA